MKRTRNSQRHTVPLLAGLGLLGLSCWGGDTILLEETIKVKPGEIWDGNGATYVSNGEFPMMTLANGCTVRNVTLIGRKTCDGILSRTAHRWLIENVRVSSCSNGLAITESWIVSVRDCHFNGCENGIALTGRAVNDLKVTGGEIAGNTVGVSITGFDHYGNKISSCIEGNKRYGIAVTGSVGSLLVFGCYFEQNGACDVYVANYAAAGVKCDSNFHLRTAVGVWLLSGIDPYIGRSTFYCKQPWLIERAVRNAYVDWNDYMNWGGFNDPKPSTSNKSATTQFHPIGMPK